jgi:hypothetical protein
MPTIYDNIEQRLLPALSTALTLSERSDFCVGYFNLRGWRQIDHLVDCWAGGPGQQCRLLVGMLTLPQQELRELLTHDGVHELDNATAALLKRRLASEFREQLTLGFPTNEDENGLRRLLAQLRAWLREAPHFGSAAPVQGVASLSKFDSGVDSYAPLTRCTLFFRQFAFPHNALMLFACALDAVFELPSIVRELFGHFVGSARHIATDCA